MNYVITLINKKVYLFFFCFSNPLTHEEEGKKTNSSFLHIFVSRNEPSKYKSNDDEFTL